MKMLSEIIVKVKKGLFTEFIEELYGQDCEIQKLNLIDNRDERETYSVNIIYGNREKFREFIQGTGKKYKIEKIINTLDDNVRGGLLTVAGKLPLENINDYQVSLFGAYELITEKIEEGEGLDYSGIVNNIGIISGIKKEADQKEKHLQKTYVALEMDSLTIHRFTGMNAYPVIIEFDQPEDILKTVQRIEKTYSGIRILQIDSMDISYYDQLYGERKVPVISREMDDIPIYILTMILKIFKKNRINAGDATIGFIGIDVSAIRLSRLLVKLGCKRVLGFDLNDKTLLSFENTEGLATTTENIFSNSDIVVLLKSNFPGEDYQKIRPGQFIVSLLDGSSHDMEVISGRGVREFIQVGRLDPSVLFPGLLRGLMESEHKVIDDARMIDFCRRLVNVVLDDYTFPDVFSDIHRIVADLINPEMGHKY